MKRGPYTGPKEYKNLAELETEVQATRFGEEDGAFIPPPEIADMEHVIRQTLEQGVRDGARWLDEAVNEVKPLSAEMRLRILLAEDAIQKATRAEVMARPYVTEADRLYRILPEYSEDLKAKLVKGNKKYAESPEGKAAEEWAKHADALDREREIADLVDQRTWWSDDLQPPELTPEQAAVLKKYVDRGVPVFIKSRYNPGADEYDKIEQESDERECAGIWARDAFYEITTGEEPKWHPPLIETMPHRVK